jgi:uncharacterized phage protein gp47/JayE
MTTITIATVDSTGISVTSYADLLAALISGFQSIYGSDIYVAPDSQDGQALSIFASGMNDAGAMAAFVFNNYSPSYAIGAGLSSAVKINGLERHTSSKSTADVTLVGVDGTLITNGVIGDNLNLGTQWTLPPSVSIDITGQVTVTATCTTDGATAAPIGSLTQILTPTVGWQTVTNTSEATPGAPVETDAQLRERQSVSTNLPAQSPLSAIAGALANLPGVQRLMVYENDTGATDSNGIPGHTIAAVIEGGDVTQICQTIEAKKTPGTGTYGSVSQIVIDQAGVPVTIRFFPLTDVPITVAITIKALSGYVSTTGGALVADVVAWINSLAIGEDVYLSKLYGPAGLNNTSLGDTYNVTSITLSRNGNPLTAADVIVAFNEAGTCATGNVTLTVI